MSFWSILGGAGLVTNVGQGIYNLYKDVNNTDNERSVEANKELMEFQQRLHLQNLPYETQAAANLYDHQFGTAAGFAKEMYDRELRDNERIAALQNQRNLYASSAARQALELRRAGISPDGASGSAGSTVAFGAPQPSAPSPSGAVPSSSAGLGSAGIGKTYSSLQVGEGLVRQEMENELQRDLYKQKTDADSRKANAEAANIEIQNKYEEQKILLSLRQQYFDISNRIKQGEKLDAETQRIYELLPKEIAEAESRVNKNNMDAESNRITANANKQNADTRVDELEQTKWRDRAEIGIKKALVKLQEAGLNLEQAKLMPQIELIKSQAAQYASQAKNLDEERPWIEARIRADIQKNEALSEELRTQAAKNQKDVDYYEWKMAAEITTSLLDSSAKVIDAVVPM